ncbi:ABC-three component system protein [Hymenobacter jejuensis]|uniref:ABC-three component systems C-terminal domain-containing protein n=1 Tax=Hymenobacter jejuensis TaxID=2502781 RepID=A0A5B7ZWW6_9BACT|nr:ABC-three component system protein [Hymenobacter jejuensis]QDA59026.1 hypothetical protein FHG12_02420 [Hymenobacter jejuensis]
MSPNFSAGPHMLGYLHQVRYSLFSLLVDRRGDTQLYVEELDDVVRRSPDVQTLEQLKHHTTPNATITEHSKELWKTLRVWFTKFAEGKLKPEESMLCLLTTAKADSPLEWLRHGSGRDVVRARVRLAEVAAARGNQELKEAYDAFSNTKEIDQERLLSAVYIVDNAPNIEEVVPKIKQLINGIRTTNLDAAYQRLEGWWFGKIVRHLLADSKDGISQYALKEQIAEINELFRPGSLPIDFEDYELTPKEEAEYPSRVFVQQLRAVNIAGMRLYNAVVDYYSAFAQRSRWVQETLIIDDDLLTYEKRLAKEWRRQIGILESKLAQGTEEEQVRFGNLLLDWMEQTADIPIRSEMPLGHEYVMRGSFHHLADDDTAPRVYWHPKFLEQLKAIMTPQS